MSASKQSAVLIIGCGYLGMRLLARLSRAGSPVWATTRNKEKISQIHQLGASATLFDLNEPDTWDNLVPLAGQRLEIYFLLPPGQIELASLHEFVAFMQTWPVHRLLMTSSSVVYGGQSRIVNADSEVDIDSPRAKQQYAIEQSLRDYGGDAKVVRLAGLYGPERIIGRQALMDGQTLPGRADSCLNLIHVDDAAELLINVMASDSAAAIELGCDGKPVSREQYYRDLAESLSSKPPVFQETEERGRGRRCDNRVTVKRTGWQPRYVDYLQSFYTERLVPTIPDYLYLS
jgi:nucleoside-diphosphate-sugar epimerase